MKTVLNYYLIAILSVGVAISCLIGNKRSEDEYKNAIQELN